jgi:Transposase domain (DUF772)
MGNDLHARVQTLARLRRGRIGVSDRWDSSGGTARDNYLTCYPAPAALLDSHQFRFILRARRERPCGRRTAEQRDELAPFHSITSSARASRVAGTAREVQINFAYRWFCGLSIQDKIPNHSVFSRARHEQA